MMTTVEMSHALEAMLLAARAPCKKRELSTHLRRFLEGDTTAAPVLGEQSDGNGDGERANAAGENASVADAALVAAALPADLPATATDGAAVAASGDEAFALTPPVAPRAPFAARFNEAFALLESRWQQRAMGGIVLCEVADGWAFRTNIKFGPLLTQHQGRPVKLSKPAFETLAIIAYRQPITKPAIDELRGVDSSTGLKALLERALIAVAGKKEEPGRPLLYATTPHFLDVFSLPKLSALPNLAEVEELLAPEQQASTDLATLAANAPELMAEDEAAHQALSDAMTQLDNVHAAARAAFVEHNILADSEADLEQGEGSDMRASDPPTIH